MGITVCQRNTYQNAWNAHATEVHAIQSAVNASLASKFIRKNTIRKWNLFFNLIDSLSKISRGNTEGWRCGQCKAGYFGNPAKGCELCRCQSVGSENNECDRETGQCKCKKNYDGYQCDECAVRENLFYSISKSQVHKLPLNLYWKCCSTPKKCRFNTEINLKLISLVWTCKYFIGLCGMQLQ